MFDGIPTGLAWSQAWSDSIDRVIQETYLGEAAHHPQLKSISVIATGGFGRRELSPFSDLDLAVVPGDEQLPGLDEGIRALFNALHYKLGTEMDLKVDYAYRVPSDAGGFDPTTRTGLLEARLIAGDPAPMDALQAAFWKTFLVGDFLIAKIEETLARHAKTHSTPLVVTPNLKLGAGGLRDLQTACWIRLALGEHISGADSSYETVLKIRNALHILKQREADELTHSAQSDLAAKHGWHPREMMHELHAAMIELHAAYNQVLADLPAKNFNLAEGVHATGGFVRFEDDSTASSAAIGVANGLQLGLRIGCLPETQAEGFNAGQALRALMHGERVIRELGTSGVLARLLPELTATLTLLPDDHAHRYTVFEHTIQAVRNLESLRDAGGFFAERYRRIQDKGALWLAALMHDAGKADQSDSHSVTGERMVKEMGLRWQMDQDRTDLVAWLVRNHLLMSHTIRMRDVSQPQTIRDFAESIPSIEHLMMLTVLTWADSNAVGPGVWTPVQDGFLQELCERTENSLQSKAPPVTDPEVVRSMLRRSLQHGEHSEEEVQSFLASMPAHYILSTSPSDAVAHLELVQRARRGETVVMFSPNEKLGATELTVAAPDAPGLLSRLLGLIYVLDISVVGLRASTTATSPAIVLDVFTLSFGGGMVPPSTGSILKNLVQQHLNDNEVILSMLRDRGKAIEVSPGEASLTYHFGSPGLLEIKGRRGRGMAFRLSRIIAREGWNVLGARVGQWAGQSTASFSITGLDGAELTPDDVSRAFNSLV